jgi:outer membrane protein assembly factor BamB
MAFKKRLVLLLLLLAGCSSEQSAPVVWEVATGYPMVTTPVVAGKYALFCSDKLYCVDALSGQSVWQFTPYGIIKTQAVVYDEKVYFNGGGLYCLDLATGRVIWEFWTDAWGEAPVAVSEGLACFFKGEKLYCLKSSTGEKLWETKTFSPLRGPVISGGRVLVVGDGKIHCIDAVGGNTLWERSYTDENTILQYAARDEKLYVACDTMIRSFSCADGSMLWSFKTGTSFLNSFAIDTATLFFVADKIYCLDAAKGTLQREHALTMYTRGIPVVEGELLFIRGAGGRLHCIDTRTGEKRWNIKTPARGTVANGYFYCGSIASKAYCIKLPE